MKIFSGPSWIQARLRRNRGRMLFCAVLIGLPVFAQTTAPVVQLRGTIRTISSEGSKAKNESPFELNATDEKYSLRVIEAVMQPALAGYYVSNLRDIYSSAVVVKPDEVADVPVRTLSPMASFRRGSLPKAAIAPRAQVLAYAYLATRLPSNGKDDVAFADQMSPQIVTAAAEVEKSEFQIQVVRKKDGSLDRVNFWGLRPGTELKGFENTRDTFLLASLVIGEAVGTMPVAGVFTVFGKRPGLTGKLVSFERRRYEFSGKIGSATEKDAFGWLTYYPGQVPKRISVTDYRFVEEDGGKARVYGLNQGDELPFAKEKLPKWQPFPVSRSFVKMPQADGKSAS
jgi:hypothetical protein